MVLVVSTAVDHPSNLRCQLACSLVETSSWMHCVPPHSPYSHLHKYVPSNVNLSVSILQKRPTVLGHLPYMLHSSRSQHGLFTAVISSWTHAVLLPSCLKWTGSHDLGVTLYWKVRTKMCRRAKCALACKRTNALTGT